jgi:membrane protein implicated in regulation of membrane protease activity
MNKIKEFLLAVSNIISSIIYIGVIMLFPIIGFVLYVKFDWWWASLTFNTISYLLLEFYSRYYFEFNKNIYKDLTKLKIHHDVENNEVWIESNDAIDSIIDIDIIKHVKLDK